MVNPENWNEVEPGLFLRKKDHALKKGNKTKEEVVKKLQQHSGAWKYYGDDRITKD
ncbi:MAG: hypothetical protein ABSA82_05735 [Thermacetogeniaceae bacterium]|jgi:hypothetical protein